MGGWHDSLAHVMQRNKKNPGEAKKKNEAVQNEKRRKAGFSRISIKLIEP
jgi:hypothetical protein